MSREVYRGAIGFISFNGYAGSGIKAISEPKAEYKETLANAQRIFAAFRAVTSLPAISAGLVKQRRRSRCRASTRAPW